MYTMTGAALSVQQPLYVHRPQMLCSHLRTLLQHCPATGNCITICARTWLVEGGDNQFRLTTCPCIKKQRQALCKDVMHVAALCSQARMLMH